MGNLESIFPSLIRSIHNIVSNRDIDNNFIVSILVRLNIFSCENNCNFRVISHVKYLKKISNNNVSGFAITDHLSKYAKKNLIYCWVYILYQLISLVYLLSVPSVRWRKSARTVLTNTNTVLETKSTVCLNIMNFDTFNCTIPYSINDNNIGYDKMMKKTYDSICIWRTYQPPRDLFAYIWTPFTNELNFFVMNQVYVLLGSLSYTIFSLIIASLWLELHPVEVPIFSFFYETNIHLEVIRFKIKAYLNSINKAFKLNTRSDWGKLNRIDSSFKSNNSHDIYKYKQLIQQKRYLLDPIEFMPPLVDKEDYQLYTPIIRSQRWKRVLSALHLILLFSTGAGVTILVCYLDLYPFFANIKLVSLNKKLKNTLKNFQLKTSHQQQDPFIECLIEQLFEFITKNQYGSEYYSNKLDLNEKADILHKMIGPNEILPVAYLLIPFAILLYMVVIIWASSAMTIIIITVIDVIVWVMLLEFELNICNSILEIQEINRSISDERKLREFITLPTTKTLGRTYAQAILERDKYLVMSPKLVLNKKLPGHKRQGSLVVPSSDYISDIDPWFKEVSRKSTDLSQFGHSERLDYYSNYYFHVKEPELIDLLDYSTADVTRKGKIISDQASIILGFHRKDIITEKDREMLCERFILTTYLNYRLFRDHIGNCRGIILYAIYIGLSPTPILLALFYLPLDSYIKIIFTILIVNSLAVCLVPVSFFHSQKSKLSRPLFSLLAKSMRYDDKIQFIANLWRRCESDLSGPKSLFDHKFVTITISYATSIEVSLAFSKKNGENGHEI